VDRDGREREGSMDTGSRHPQQGLHSSNTRRKLVHVPSNMSLAHLTWQVPLVDGHNDLPHAFRKGWKNKLSAVNLNANQTGVHVEKLRHGSLHTDCVRLRKGGAGAQFWSGHEDHCLKYETLLTLLSPAPQCMSPRLSRVPTPCSTPSSRWVVPLFPHRPPEP